MGVNPPVVLVESYIAVIPIKYSAIDCWASPVFWYPVAGTHSLFRLRNSLSIGALPQKISPPTHALLYPISAQLLAVLMAALVRVNHHTCRSPTRLNSHGQCLHRQFAVRRQTKSPVHRFSGKQVHYHRLIAPTLATPRCRSHRHTTPTSNQVAQIHCATTGIVPGLVNKGYAYA